MGKRGLVVSSISRSDTGFLEFYFEWALHWGTSCLVKLRMVLNKFLFAEIEEPLSEESVVVHDHLIYYLPHWNEWFKFKGFLYVQTARQ